MSPLLRLGGDARVGKIKSPLIFFSRVSIKTIMWCKWSTESLGFVLSQPHLVSSQVIWDLAILNILGWGLQKLILT